MSAIDRHAVGDLQALVVIHDTLSITEAARRLDLSQSTVSYIVKNLRQSFADPLFIRIGNRLEPTPRCLDIVAGLRPALMTLDVLASGQPFRPADATGEIVISCNYHERRATMPAALREIRAQAPHLKIDLHEAAVDGRRQLIENLVDIVLGPVAMLGEIFYRTHLFDDRYVCVMDPANPFAIGELTLERYEKARHLMVTHNRRWQAIFQPLLRAQGVHIQPSLSVPSHDSIELLLPGSDLVASIPERLAQEFAGPFVVKPFPIDVPIKIDMFWTERTHHSGAHAWVRGIIARTARQEFATARSDPL